MTDQGFFFEKSTGSLAAMGTAGLRTAAKQCYDKAHYLQKKLEEVNAVKNLTNRVPAVAEVQKMIDQAKELPAVMEY